MRHSLERDFLAQLGELEQFLRVLDIKSGDELLCGMLSYIASSMDTSQTAECILDVLREEVTRRFGERCHDFSRAISTKR